MDCFKSAKESNITYFMAGETRLKNTTNGTHNRLVHQETLKHLVKPGPPTGQTFKSTICSKNWPSIWPTRRVWPNG